MYLKVLLTYFVGTLIHFPALFIFGVCPCRLKVFAVEKGQGTLTLEPSA